MVEVNSGVGVKVERLSNEYQGEEERCIAVGEEGYDAQTCFTYYN